MTVKEALRKFQAKLPNDETELFLSHLLNYPKAKLYTHPEEKLSDKNTEKLYKMVQMRLKGVPVAYILGYKYFYGLKFKVNKSVLIPRPESEWLIDKALDLIKEDTNLKVLDLGTGSGAIAISLAKEVKRRKISVYASDISASALKVAKENAKHNNVKINFVLSNLLLKHQKSFDIIIANLPYVPMSDYEKLKPNLKYEPKIALTDGTDNAVLYEKLLKQIQTLKQKPKYILFEIDPTFEKPIIDFTSTYLPNATTKFEKDINGLIRFAVIKIGK